MNRKHHQSIPHDSSVSKICCVFSHGQALLHHLKEKSCNQSMRVIPKKARRHLKSHNLRLVKKKLLSTNLYSIGESSFTKSTPLSLNVSIILLMGIFASKNYLYHIHAFTKQICITVLQEVVFSE